MISLLKKSRFVQGLQRWWWAQSEKKEVLKREGDNRFFKRAQIQDEVLLSVLGKDREQTDISDHLSTLYGLALISAPKLIVELGTRGGESTRALLAGASRTGATILSIDIEDCGDIEMPFKDQWNFIKADDVEFGKNEFEGWCKGKGLEPQIDFLFIDTSHVYEHTKDEVAIWEKFLSPGGVMAFHDTNMGDGYFKRMDGSVGIGWDNKRGVIRVVEELIGREYDASSFFCDTLSGYAIIHFPFCNGLTVMKKLPEGRK
ncbi:class I SAM-dependent methyltransferase [bacterium]|nr:class I SAM-dependent methyltransferase [bacterium]